MLKEKIQEDLIKAMKQGEKSVVSTLRMLQASIKNKEIQVMREIDYQEVLGVIEREIKQRKEAAEGFTQGGRAESAAQETEEMEILKHYLPEQMGEEEVRKIVEETIAESSATSISDMGKVMGLLTPKLRGKADMGMVSGIVKEKLS
jgi:uncharacterized protein YqeY